MHEGSSRFLELLHTIAALHLNYYFTVSNFANDTFLHTSPWSLKSLIVLCAMLGGAFQTFYGLRIRNLSKRWEIPLLCWGMAIGNFAMLLVIVISLGHFDLSSYLDQHRHFLLGFLALQVFMDFLNPVAIVYYLRKREPPASLSIRRYALLAIESGFIVFLITLCALGTGINSTNTYCWLAIVVVRDKVLTNCIMTSLNSRHLWKSGLPFVDYGKSRSGFRSSKSPKSPKVIDIQVEKFNTSSSTPSVCEESDSLQ